MRVPDLGAIDGYDSLYVSPHLDDAALSCPARILDETRSGMRVLIVTLFSEGPAYEERHAEEARAAAELHADHFLAGFVDAPFRSQLYHGFDGIVFGLDATDAALVADLGDRLAEIAARARPSVVRAPLGVGNHVDHRLCHQAARALAGVRFYEDRPYALVHHAVRLRLHELGLRGDAPDLGPIARDDLVTELFRSFLSVSYVKRYLGDEDRHTCIEKLQALSAGAEDLRGALAKSEILEADEGRLPEIFLLASLYGSQIEDLYESYDDFREGVLRASAGMGRPGRYVERSWALPKDP